MEEETRLKILTIVCHLHQCVWNLPLILVWVWPWSMQQEIFEDPHNFEAWDLRETSRCFVTIANAEQWIDLTGEEPPISPLSASDYTKAGLPWFNFYGGDKASIKGAKKLGKIKSVNQINLRRNWLRSIEKDYRLKTLKLFL